MILYCDRQRLLPSKISELLILVARFISNNTHISISIHIYIYICILPNGDCVLVYIYPRTQTGFKSLWWDTHTLDIWQRHCQIALKTVCYKPYWKASAWVLLCTLHKIHITKGFDKKKIITFHMCSSTCYIYFHLFYNAFPPKIILDPCPGLGWKMFICGHGHRAKTWRTVGQSLTYSRPKTDVSRAEKWYTCQNATLECFNDIIPSVEIGLWWIFIEFKNSKFLMKGIEAGTWGVCCNTAKWRVENKKSNPGADVRIFTKPLNHFSPTKAMAATNPILFYGKVMS